MARFPTGDPIWGIMEHQGRTLAWLARRTGYSHTHVKNVKGGHQNASAEFRRRCAAALDIPEKYLFQPDPADAPEATDAKEPADVA